MQKAKSGGVSDPRNNALIKMFNLIDVGERAGSGIPNIYSVWKKQGWSAPVIAESFEPARITLSLPLEKTSDKKQVIKASDKKQATKTVAYREAIVAYLTENVSAKCSELSTLVGISDSRTRAILSRMIEDDILVAEGENRNRTYKLKA